MRGRSRNREREGRRRELRRRAGLILGLVLWGLVLWGLVLWGGCGRGSLGHVPRAQFVQARNVEGAELAGEAHRAVSAALLLLYATDVVLAGVEYLCHAVDLDCQPSSAREDGIAGIVLSAGRARHAEIGGPPVGRRKPDPGTRGRGGKYRRAGEQLR